MSILKPYDDISTLLDDLHKHVLEIKACNVLASDKPQSSPPTLGFALYPFEPDSRAWDYQINLVDLQRSGEKLDAPYLLEALSTTPSRIRIARMLTHGMDAARIEDRLSDPAVRYVHNQLKAMKAQADKAFTAAQAEKQNPARIFQRESLLGPARPAVTHFLLQQRISALSELLDDLELGMHLITPALPMCLR